MMKTRVGNAPNVCLSGSAQSGPIFSSVSSFSRQPVRHTSPASRAANPMVARPSEICLLPVQEADPPSKPWPEPRTKSAEQMVNGPVS
jgi:hypothetical protein